MTNAKAGPGFLLSKGDGGGPEVFTTIAEVRDIAGPGVKSDVHDATNQSSPGGVEEIIPTIKRTEDVTFPVNFNAADPTHDQITGLKHDADTQTLRHFHLGLKTGTFVVDFHAYVIAVKWMAPVAGVLSGEITLKPSGPVDLVAL
jgi:hypothetical protein